MTQIVGLAAAWHQGKVEGNPMGTSSAGNPKTNKTSVHAEFQFLFMRSIKTVKIFCFVENRPREVTAIRSRQMDFIV